MPHPMDIWLLTLVIFSPLFSALLLWIPPRGGDVGARRSAFFCSLVTLALAVIAMSFGLIMTSIILTSLLVFLIKKDQWNGFDMVIKRVIRK